MVVANGSFCFLFFGPEKEPNPGPWILGPTEIACATNWAISAFPTFFRSSWGCIWARDTRSGEGVGRASGLARVVGHRSVPSSLLRVICCKRVWCCFRNPGGRVLPAFGRAGCVLSLCLCFCKINCACFSLCLMVIFITLCGYGL